MQLAKSIYFLLYSLIDTNPFFVILGKLKCYEAPLHTLTITEFILCSQLF